MNNNTTIAPAVPFLLIIGVMLMAVLPPLGLVVILFAIPAQRRFRRQHRAMKQIAYAHARQKLRREKILAVKSLLR